MKESLKKLYDYAQKNNIKVYFSIIPDIHFLEDYPFSSIHQKVAGIAKELNFKVVDLQASLEGIPFEKLQIIPGDSHPNAYGHQLIAEELSDVIIPDLE